MTCITAVSPSLNSQIDPRFGRCAYFIFVDPESLKFEVIPNEANSQNRQGMLSANLLIKKGTKVLITGHMGKNAFKVLNSAGIRMFKCSSDTIRHAIDRLKRGELEELMPEQVFSDRSSNRVDFLRIVIPSEDANGFERKNMRALW